ncbi:hypothetical protein [Sorangium sp. So ce1099]|uniref:hypothetical protein n=1 Tax=Sorangium sp. So ce1099 TaxID=3133331 RepID=UPI003F61B3F9
MLLLAFMDTGTTDDDRLRRRRGNDRLRAGVTPPGEPPLVEEHGDGRVACRIAGDGEVEAATTASSVEPQ